MDQEKIGRFIATCRKENGYTQASLAEKLGVTDKAVSKWENARSMPDTSIILELCELLNINVNELLTGEHIAMEQYMNSAEKRLLELQEQLEAKNRKSLKEEKIVFNCSIFSYCIMCLTAFVFVENAYIQMGIMLCAILQLVCVIYCCVRIEREVGMWECPHCGAMHKPTGYDVIMSPHILRSMRRCPACEKRGKHKRIINC